MQASKEDNYKHKQQNSEQKTNWEQGRQSQKARICNTLALSIRFYEIFSI